MWALAETVAAGAVAHLPIFASYGWPTGAGRGFLVSLGVITCINALSEFRSTGKWQAAAIVFGVRLWTASVFVGMGWLRLAFPEFAAATDRIFTGPIGHIIVGFGVFSAIISLGTLLTRRGKWNSDPTLTP